MSVAVIALCCNLTFVNGNIYSLLQLMKKKLFIRDSGEDPSTPKGIPSEFSLFCGAFGKETVTDHNQ